MNPLFKDNKFWICHIKTKDIEKWANRALDGKATLMGIKSWIVPLKINHDGDINESI